MFENIVSKKTVSFENSNLPKLGTVLKSFLQDEIDKVRIIDKSISKFLI